MTVKTRVVGDQALAELPHFKSGDRIVLTWSGFDTYADAISTAVRYDASKKWNEPFTFPVEFVAYEGHSTSPSRSRFRRRVWKHSRRSRLANG